MEKESHIAFKWGNRQHLAPGMLEEEQQEDEDAKRHNTSFGIEGTWMCSQRFEEEPTTSGLSHKVFCLQTSCHFYCREISM
jgi:hypothetical protein